ncbi:MAG: hypothetical protein WCB36_12820 [Burkholderiales bacterium]
MSLYLTSKIMVFIMILAALGFRRYWLHVVAALSTMLVNSSILLFGFDGVARAAVIETPNSNSALEEYYRGVQALRVGLMDYRFFILFSCFGLCLLILRQAKN